MTPKPGDAPEQAILRARAAGELTPDAAFERLYSLYARSVLAWLAVRAGRSVAEDLYQDVWTIFYRRWPRWAMLPEMEAPGARPVLSFLYRTAAFVLRGYERRLRANESIDCPEESASERLPEALVTNPRQESEAQLGQCLAVAHRLCPAEELEVLVARLEGLSGREISRALGITAAMADHRYRQAVERIRLSLGSTPRSSGRRRNA